MNSPGRFSRRDVLAILGAAGTAAAVDRTRSDAQTAASPVDSALTRNDAAVRALLDNQITDAASPWRGCVPDQFELHSAGSAGGVAETLTASFIHPRSRFHADNTLLERIRLAAGFLERS